MLARRCEESLVRDYEVVIDTTADGSVKRSSFNRAFKTASVGKIAEIEERRLDDTRFTFVLIDRIEWMERR